MCAGPDPGEKPAEEQQAQ